MVAAATMASRVLGFVRDATIMHFFAGQGSDVFAVAFTIPNTLRRLTAEGALAIAFVPVYTETLAREGRDAAKRLLAAMGGVALGLLALLVLLGILLAPWITYLNGAGFRSVPGKFELTARLLQWYFPYLLLVSLAALSGAALNSHRRFFAPAFSTVLLNLSMIGTIWLLTDTCRVHGLAGVFSTAPGVLLGGVLQLALQIVYLRREGMTAWPRWDLGHPGVRKVLRLTGPMILGLASYQLMIFAANLFASLLAEGTATYLYNSSRLVELPQAVFGMAIATASLPTLSRFRTDNDMAGLKETYTHSLGLALFVTLPACAGLIVLARPIVTVLYQRGAFTPAMTQATAETLAAMALQVGAVTVVRQTVQVFYALQDTRTPVKASFASLLAYVVFALWLMRPLEHVGLALAMTLAATAQAVVLLAILRVRIGRLGLRALLKRGLIWIAAAAVMCVACWAASRLGRWEEGGNAIRNIGVLGLALAAGLGAYLAAAALLRAPELAQLKSALGRRARP